VGVYITRMYIVLYTLTARPGLCRLPALHLVAGASALFGVLK